MSETLEIKEPKAVKNRTYACCPICSKTLVQADYIRNGIIKCENCRRRVYVVQTYREDIKQNVDVMHYTPAYCPVCGREIIENKKYLQEK